MEEYIELTKVIVSRDGHDLRRWVLGGTETHQLSKGVGPAGHGEGNVGKNVVGSMPQGVVPTKQGWMHLARAACAWECLNDEAYKTRKLNRVTVAARQSLLLQLGYDELR